MARCWLDVMHWCYFSPSLFSPFISRHISLGVMTCQSAVRSRWDQSAFVKLHLDKLDGLAGCHGWRIYTGWGKG